MADAKERRLPFVETLVFKPADRQEVPFSSLLSGVLNARNPAPLWVPATLSPDAWGGGLSAL